eukprot:TRINITY_DN42410_c0_g1_i1.p1 TRINITY_DN42410_c0_g1~~TRINITY_DN42410_c0_g1_i1.p1  ORF type:complete len:544 (-),score=147.14 TRINITY_DN42410_c0_g1_i1:251-1810(-)
MGGSMGLPKAVESAVIEREATKNFNVAVAEYNGWRNDMEDAHLIYIRDDVAVFGVYDGHGGKDCSKFAARRLNEELEKDGIPKDDDAWEKLFIKVDQEFLDSDMSSGSTATMCVVRKPDKAGGKHKLHVINAGDSRVLLGKADGSIVDGGGTDKGLTRDHKPEDPEETKRIEKAGGRVEKTEGNVSRVNGNLSVCRGFGDRDEKKTGGPGPENRPVTCIPEQHHFECDETDFVLLVCDGVSEGNFSNEEVVKLVADCLQEGKDAGQAASAVCLKAMERDSKDNITCMAVQLRGVSEPFPRKLEFIPGAVTDIKNKAYREAYTHMAEKANFSLAQAVAKRYDVVQEQLKVKPHDEDLKQEAKELGSAPGKLDSEERAKWSEKWLADHPEEEGGNDQMDMMQQMMAAKGGGKGYGKDKGKAEPEPQEEIEKDEGGYTWSQKGEEVQVVFKLKKVATKKDVKVGFKTASLSVGVHGEVLLDGGIAGKVDTDDCTWCLANGGTELQVMLTKQSAKDNWAGLLK